jgi:signal transduction histidine kinase/CheY-like chemotaxis protein
MLPLLVADRVSGILAIFTRTAHDFSGEELAVLTSCAAQVAIALENARLFAELKSAYEDVQRAQDELIRSEKLRALGQMAAGMAHDLNNMLAAVLGQTELLRLRVSDPSARDSLNTLAMAATDGAQVVRRLQEFARQQPGQTLTAVDLGSTVRETLEITRSRWKDEPQQRGAVIQVEMELADLPPILGVASEIREALTNLVFNAVDAMPHGGVLTVRGRLAEAPPRSSGETPFAPEATDHPVVWVELAVSDTGVGMSEEVRRRVFDPFFTTKGLRGTGLGLSVVYGIMQRHGGHIDVESIPGGGTTFTLRFQAATQPAAIPRPVASAGSVISRTLYLIDDDTTVRRTLAELLRSAGHTVTEFDDGATAVHRLGANPPDLVLTDLGMPEMSGWEVAQACKVTMPHLPVVLLTGWGERPADEAAHAGVTDRILGKPVRLEELLTAIRDLTRSPADPADPLS